MKVLLIALLSGVLLSGCGNDEEDPSSSSSSNSSSGSSVINEPIIAGDASLGKDQYQQYCQVCHGAEGEGSAQLKSPPLVGCSVCEQPNLLSTYIEAEMPPGGTSAVQSCSGACADNTAAYIITEFNKKLDTASCGSGDQSPSSNVFKRLSRQEYASTVQSLLKMPQAPNVEAIPDDPSVHNFQTIASIQGVQANHLNGYISVATEVAESLMDSASQRDSVLQCDYTSTSCLDSFIEYFGRLAYRRPLTTDEASRISQYALDNSSSTTDQFVLAIQLMLSSPNFIFRVEVGNNPEGLATLNAYELASRLAFSLWGQGPSAELLDQAEAGNLDNPDGLRDIAREMLEDPKAKQNLSLFFEQWLATNLLKTPVDKPANWYSSILDDMRSETNSLLGEYVWQDRNFMNVFTSNQTYLSPSLANYYGLPRPQTNNGTVTLPSGDPRESTGILTHAANMFPKTDGDLVAIRGNWLRSTFLCRQLELPDGITEIINGQFSGYTPIQIIEARNADTSCDRCHAQIDPIGIAFTPFTRDGLFDHSVNISDYPIEPGFPDSGDPSVKSVQDIAHALSQMPEVGQCLAERLFLYTRSHEAQDDDKCTVHNANQAFQDSGYQFTSLLLSLVEDPLFRTRLAPEASNEEPQTENKVTNIALNKPVSTSSAQDGNPGSRLTDNDTNGNARWSAQFYPQTATIDLGGIYNVVQTEVYPFEDRVYQYTIEASSNGSNYTQIVDRSQNTEGANTLSDLFSPTKARYIRLRVTGASGYTGDWISIREVKVFGTQN